MGEGIGRGGEGGGKGGGRSDGREGERVGWEGAESIFEAGTGCRCGLQL